MRLLSRRRTTPLQRDLDEALARVLAAIEADETQPEQIATLQRAIHGATARHLGTAMSTAMAGFRRQLAAAHGALPRRP